MRLVSFRINLIRGGKQLISLNDTGPLNRKIPFSGGMGRGRANTKTRESKYKKTYVRPHITTVCVFINNLLAKPGW